MNVIKIPHLNARVVVTKKKKGDLDDADGYVKRVCPGEYELHLKLPIKGPITGSHLVHEIVHLIQYIVEDHNMTFIHEREHLAYIAGYLFREVCKCG